MKGRSGEVLWEDTIKLGIEMRKKIRSLHHEYEESETDPQRQWFFDPFVPDVVQVEGLPNAGKIFRRTNWRVMCVTGNSFLVKNGTVLVT